MGSISDLVEREIGGAIFVGSDNVAVDLVLRALRGRDIIWVFRARPLSPER